MKKITAAILIACMLFVLAGCGKTEEEPTTAAPVLNEDELVDEDGFRAIRDYVVTVQDGVSVRKEASDKGEIFLTLDEGVNLNRTGIKDGWNRVQINGASYYIESKYLQETTIKWATETDTEKVSHVVFIDPAKQITEDRTLEAISPDIDTSSMNLASPTSAAIAGTKAKMTSGAIGVYTGNFEYDITLDVANYLNAELMKRGYTVYMSRTSNNADLSNAKRAQMANANNAEVYIKIEAPASNDPTASGILGFIATSMNSHSGSNYQNNYELCYDILKTTCASTSAKRLGIYETDNLTSLNYCDMPATVISIGFLSNENDDIYLGTEDYKKQVALGIAKGVDLYFENIESGN